MKQSGTDSDRDRADSVSLSNTRRRQPKVEVGGERAGTERVTAGYSNMLQASTTVQNLATLQAHADQHSRQASSLPLQAATEDEDRESVSLQRQSESNTAPNRTGMPDNLKSGIENLSGLAMDDVRVHYNSSRPAEVSAHAYAQGSDIHLGPGQEKHLPHEAWHLVQQKQGRVQPTTQVAGQLVNDDPGLEEEADVMGTRALQAISLDAGKSGEEEDKAV